MIGYIIEFSILHLLFFGIYKVMLAKETQLSFLRFFLIGSTLLSLILPAIEIPTQADIPTINMEAVVLPMVYVPTEQASPELPWYTLLIGLVSAAFTLKLFVNLVQIYGWYRQSEADFLEEMMIRKVAGLQNSFTFFKWIFIDPKNFENPADIIRHEQGHAKKMHSLDLLFFHTLTIFFWWLPSVWLMIKELKTVHEFEADDYALRINDTTYTKTLVQCTLKAHGMDLASSFDDAPIFNRLNFMKKMKKKISVWKVASIAALAAISGVMFACEEQLESDQRNAEEISAETQVFLETIQGEYPEDKFTLVLKRLPNGAKIDDLDGYEEQNTVYMRVEESVNNQDRNVEMIQSSEASAKYDLVRLRAIVDNLSNDDETEVIVERLDDSYQYTEGSGEDFEIILESIDDSAEFPGGRDGLSKYLSENMRYPQQAQNLGIEGIVYVQFVVEKDGSISNVKILKGIGAGCDAEAKRVIKESPKWIPASNDGQPVQQELLQKIAFKLPS